MASNRKAYQNRVAQIVAPAAVAMKPDRMMYLAEQRFSLLQAQIEQAKTPEERARWQAEAGRLGHAITESKKRLARRERRPAGKQAQLR